MIEAPSACLRVTAAAQGHPRALWSTAGIQEAGQGKAGKLPAGCEGGLGAEEGSLCVSYHPWLSSLPPGQTALQPAFLKLISSFVQQLSYLPLPVQSPLPPAPPTLKWAVGGRSVLSLCTGLQGKEGRLRSLGRSPHSIPNLLCTPWQVTLFLRL